MATWIVFALLGLVIGGRVFWLLRYGPVEKTVDGVFHHRFLGEGTMVRQVRKEWAEHPQGVWSFLGESAVYLSKEERNTYIIANVVAGRLDRLTLGNETVEAILRDAHPRRLCADALRNVVARYGTTPVEMAQLPTYLHGWDGASR